MDLLNQVEDKNHYVKYLQLENTKIVYEDVAALYGLTNFIPKSSLNRSGTSISYEWLFVF